MDEHKQRWPSSERLGGDFNYDALLEFVWFVERALREKRRVEPFKIQIGPGNDDCCRVVPA